MNNPAHARSSSGANANKVDPLEQHLPALDPIGRMAGQDFGQRRFARAVRPHDRMDFSESNRKVKPF